MGAENATTPLTVALSASLTISAFDALLWYSSQFSPVMAMLTRATADIEIVGAADGARHSQPEQSHPYCSSSSSHVWSAWWTQ